MKKQSKSIANMTNNLQIDLQNAIAIHKNGDIVRAEKIYLNILKRQPLNFDCNHLLGVVYLQTGRLDHALKFIKRSIQINPNISIAHSNLGNVYKRLHDTKESILSYINSTKCDPKNADAHYNLGLIYHENYDYQNALSCYKAAIDLTPRNPNIYNNYGALLNTLGAYADAFHYLQEAIKLDPNHLGAWINAGNSLFKLNNLSSALEFYTKASFIEPFSAEALKNSGDAQRELGDFYSALDSYLKALSINENYQYLKGLIVDTRLKMNNWDGLGDLTVDICNKIKEGNNVSMPFSVLTFSDDPNLQLKAAKIYSESEYPAIGNIKFHNTHNQTRKIRIGYLSMDFREHPVAHLIAELIEVHSRDSFEYIAFSYGPESKTGIGSRIRNAFDTFIDISHCGDLAAVNLIRDNNIDILVDLAGYTHNARTGILSHKPAPVQVNFLGYPGTMGAPYIDYIIADRVLIPEHSQQFYTENIVYLPGSYQPNDTKKVVSTRVYTRAEEGLPDDAFVYCCFNNNYKITPEVFSSWTRILNAVPNSVLWLLEDNNISKTNLINYAVASGINQDRIVFAKRVPLEFHLARQKLADIFLDTFPYNAHTTASDALWSGLPVLTLMGQSFASRVAASLLNSLELNELITITQNDYEAKAIDLGLNTSILTSITKKLNDNRSKSTLFNPAAYAANIEAAYALMHKRFISNSPHTNICIHSE